MYLKKVFTNKRKLDRCSTSEKESILLAKGGMSHLGKCGVKLTFLWTD